MLQSSVFLSYARADGSIHAERLEKALTKAKFKTWRDTRGIDPTKDFTAEIERAIKTSSFVVTCITSDVEREDSFVRREIQYALLIDKPVIVARFEDVIPPIHVIDNTWVEFHKGWETAFPQLCDILRKKPADYDNSPLRPEIVDPFRLYVQWLYDHTVLFFEGPQFLKFLNLDTVSASGKVSASSLPALAPRPQSRGVFGQLFYAQGIGESTPDDQPVESMHFTRFDHAVERYNGQVLLLGEPGAGKTSTLMAYVRDAAAKRLSDPSAPLPLFNLVAMWDAEQQTPLHEWLSESHDTLTPDAVRHEIECGQVLLLFDGLDELGGKREDKRKEKRELIDPRKLFIDALAEAITMQNQVIVTCRVKDYADIEQKIGLAGAVILQPLTEDQLRDYLRDTPELWTALESDEELKTIARTPLLLYLFADAYRDENFTNEERQRLANLHHSPADLRDQILERYVHGRYERERRRMNADLPFTLEEIYRVLGQVALDHARKFQEITIGDEDFVKVLDKEHMADFARMATQLHLIIPHEEVRFRFIHLLLRDYFAYPWAVKRLNDLDANIRSAAVEALGRLEDARAVEPLINMLTDDDVEVRRNVVYALSHFSDPLAAEALVSMFGDDAIEIRDSVGRPLIGLGDIAIDALVQALESDNIDIRTRAAFYLVRFGKPETLEPLVRLLTDHTEVTFSRFFTGWRASEIVALALVNSMIPEAGSAVEEALKNGNIRFMPQTDVIIPGRAFDIFDIDHNLKQKQHNLKQKRRWWQFWT